MADMPHAVKIVRSAGMTASSCIVPKRRKEVPQLSDNKGDAVGPFSPAYKQC